MTVSSTIKTSGGTFTTVAAWDAAILDGDNEIGSCESSAALQTGGCTFAAPNTGTPKWTRLLTAASANAVAAPTYSECTSKARIEHTSPGLLARAFTISGHGYTIEKIGIYVNNGVLSYGFGTSGAYDVTLRRCAFYMDNCQGQIYIDNGGTWTIDNMAIFGGCNGGDQLFVTYGAGTVNVYNSSIASSQNPYQTVQRDAGTLNCYGVIVQDSGGGNADFAGTIGGNYNVSRDATAPGANSIVSVSGVYTDRGAGTQDLSLTSGSWNGIVNRSGFPSDTDTDITGTTRPSTGADPGCWQTPSAPAGNTSGFFFAAGG